MVMYQTRKYVLCCAGLLALLAPTFVFGEEGGEKGSHHHEEHIRVIRTGGMSPFRSIEWSVVVLNETPVARQRKTMVNYTENMGSMRLLTRAEYSAMWRDIEPLNPFSLPPNEDTQARSEGGSVRYRVELARGGEVRSWIVEGDEVGVDDPVFNGIVSAVRAVVEEHTEPIPFRNVFFEEGEIGYVDVDSIPPARVYLDGVDIQRKTPLHTYEIRRGKHEIRLVAEEEGIDRTYTFRVQPGMTTVLRLDLR